MHRIEVGITELNVDLPVALLRTASAEFVHQNALHPHEGDGRHEIPRYHVVSSKYCVSSFSHPSRKIEEETNSKKALIAIMVGRTFASFTQHI